MPEKKPFAERIVNTGRFEAIVAVFIFLNAILIGIQADQEAKAQSVHFTDDWIFEALNAGFTIVFLVEIMLRIAAQKCLFFYGPGFGWNYLDIAIVLTSILELVSLILTAINLAQFRILRLIRVTKLLRVIRITRIVRTIRALRVMVHQLLSTIRSLMWALLLLALIVYVFAILMTQSFAGYYTEGDLSLETENGAAMIEYWSSLARSMLTLFQSVTGGVNWEDALAPLMDIGPLAPALFLVYICFTEFAVLNVLTGVFCQSAIESAGHDYELLAQNMLENKHQYIQKVKHIFADLDLNGKGVISVEELKDRLNDLKVQAYFETLDLDMTDLNAVMVLMELEPGGLVNVEDFVDGCLRLKGSASNLSIAKLSRTQEAMKKRLQFVTNFVEERIAVADAGQASLSPRDREVAREEDLFGDFLSTVTSRRSNFVAPVEEEGEEEEKVRDEELGCCFTSQGSDAKVSAKQIEMSNSEVQSKSGIVALG